jgi:hypothetical protein
VWAECWQAVVRVHEDVNEAVGHRWQEGCRDRHSSVRSQLLRAVAPRNVTPATYSSPLALVLVLPFLYPTWLVLLCCRWKQQQSPKQCYLSTRLHGITFQKTVNSEKLDTIQWCQSFGSLRMAAVTQANTDVFIQLAANVFCVALTALACLLTQSVPYYGSVQCTALSVPSCPTWAIIIIITEPHITTLTCCCMTPSHTWRRLLQRPCFLSVSLRYRETCSKIRFMRTHQTQRKVWPSCHVDTTDGGGTRGGSRISPPLLP